MTTPDRKRPLGQAMPWKPHRQRDTAERAQAAGYQLKRAAVPPLLQVEMEPGQAVRTALEIPHPFSLEPPLPPDLQEALAMAVLHPEATLKHRSGALEYWGRRAEQLLPVTDQLLQTLPDPHLRRLLRGCPDGAALQLGSCAHIALWRELMAAARCIDVGLLDDMLHGFPVIGPVARSGRWARLSAPAVLSETDLHERAWEFFSKVSGNVERAELTEYSGKVWEATMEDVAEKVTVGPFFLEAEVSSFVGTKVWVPTQRFEVVQKNKVRGVDSATSNGVNMATEVQEKLDLPSTDLNVAALRWIRTHLPAECHVEGWVLDERKAYRQIPIRPGHRRWSVISLKDPADGRVAFFVMIGHSFGLVSAVYNYNRRSAAISDILRRVFLVAAFNFYDDKYGFETNLTCGSAFEIAQKIHFSGWGRLSIRKSCSSAGTPRSWGSRTTCKACGS